MARHGQIDFLRPARRAWGHGCFADIADEGDGRKECPHQTQYVEGCMQNDLLKKILKK